MASKCHYPDGYLNIHILMAILRNMMNHPVLGPNWLFFNGDCKNLWANSLWKDFSQVEKVPLYTCNPQGHKSIDDIHPLDQLDNASAKGQKGPILRRK